MPTVYTSDGKAFLRNGAVAVGDCCCDECALVVVSVGISSYHSEPGSGGSGIHVLDSEVTTVCAAHARVAAETMADLWRESDSQNCLPSPACGSERAYAICESQAGKIRVPYKKGNSEVQVGAGYFESTRTNVGSADNWAKWTLSINYYGQNGGAATARTKKPNVRVRVSGTDYATNGTDQTWPNFKTTTAVPGGRMGRFDWEIYFT